jgi:hypothetical protein
VTKSTGKRIVSKHGAPVKERLMLHTDKLSSACWLWTGAKDKRGYGKINIAGRYVQTHRAAWAEFNGDPGLRFVCHHCDIPACLNPEHLFLGTQQDNMSDMTAKDRQSKGNALPQTKLTEELVRTIRSTKISCRIWASATGTTPMAISKVRTRKTWKHVS